jgi:hypothetical protein
MEVIFIYFFGACKALSVLCWTNSAASHDGPLHKSQRIKLVTRSHLGTAPESGHFRASTALRADIVECDRSTVSSSENSAGGSSHIGFNRDN